jgi:hypothetical protein
MVPTERTIYTAAYASSDRYSLISSPANIYNVTLQVRIHQHHPRSERHKELKHKHKHKQLKQLKQLSLVLH